MRFGIHNPSWLFGSDPYRMFEELKRKARWAEQHGYTWFSVMDHLIQIPNVGQPEEPFMEGWTVLSALAAVTEKIRLATLVTSVAYRNPALLAKMAAGVDIISGGRLTFGFGAGWHYQEYGQYGYEFPERPAVRIRQMEEALRLIKLIVDRAARHLLQQILPHRRSHPRAETAAKASSADHDWRERRAADAARAGAPRRCLQPVR